MTTYVLRVSSDNVFTFMLSVQIRPSGTMTGEPIGYCLTCDNQSNQLTKRDTVVRSTKLSKTVRVQAAMYTQRTRLCVISGLRDCQQQSKAHPLGNHGERDVAIRLVPSLLDIGYCGSRRQRHGQGAMPHAISPWGP